MACTAKSDSHCGGSTTATRNATDLSNLAVARMRLNELVLQKANKTLTIFGIFEPIQSYLTMDSALAPFEGSYSSGGLSCAML